MGWENFTRFSSGESLGKPEFQGDDFLTISWEQFSQKQKLKLTYIGQPFLDSVHISKSICHIELLIN